MIPNRNELQFYTGDPVDKIVAAKVQRTIVNDGDTVGATGSFNSAKIVTEDYANPYGEKCFVRGRWSTNGGISWQNFEAHIVYNFILHLVGSFTGDQDAVNLRSAVSIGVSDTTVRIVTANGLHGDVTFDVDTFVETYTPVSLTFIIEYELFEVL